MDFLKEINTDGVEPMSHINEIPKIDFLREDVEDKENYTLTKKELLSNAKDKNEDYIITTKVVK
ncbi:UNVERIFIED_CONTAM: aspartyl/glutamyl-tRNA amidotransferase subunit C [Campylobacter lari]